LRKNYVLQVLEPFERNDGANAIVAGGERRSYAGIRRTTPRLARILHNQGVRAGAGVAVLATGAIGSVALHLVGGRPGWIVTCATGRVPRCHASHRYRRHWAGAGVAALATGAIGSVALHLVGGRPGWMVTCAPVRGQAALATFTQRDVAICTVAERRERIAGELTGHGGLLKIFSAGAAGRENGSLRRAERGPGRVRRGTGGPDPESVCYTSGTTGKPKARPAWRGYYAALPASPSTT